MWSILGPAATAAREWNEHAAGILMTVKSIMLVLFTLSCFFQDLKKRTISLRTFEIFGLFGIAFFLCSLTGFHRPADFWIRYILLAALLPLSLLFISYLTGESIGIGDSLYFLVSALYTSPGDNFIIFCISAAGAGIAGLTLTAFCMKAGRSARRKSLPFMAFIFPAVIITGLL